MSCCYATEYTQAYSFHIRSLIRINGCVAFRQVCTDLIWLTAVEKAALSVAACHIHAFLMKSDHRIHMNINAHVLKRQSVSSYRWRCLGSNILTDQKAHWIPSGLLNPWHLCSFCLAHFGILLQIDLIWSNQLINMPIVRFSWVGSSRTRIEKHCYALDASFKFDSLSRNVMSMFTCRKLCVFRLKLLHALAVNFLGSMFTLCKLTECSSRRWGCLIILE